MSTTTAECCVDPEFQALVPPLASDERAQLEANILKDGCRDAITTWKGLIIDGHNRFAICEAHELEYDVSEIDLPDRDSARIWIIQNQLGRRNLSDYDRGVLALKLKPLIAARAKENQREHGETAPGKAKSLSAKLPEVMIDTRAEVAKVAGVSEGTIRKIEVIEEEAPEPLKEAVRNGEKSIHAAFQEVRPKPAKQKAIEAGTPDFTDEDESANYPPVEIDSTEEDEEDHPFALDASEEDESQDDDDPSKFWHQYEKTRSDLRRHINTLMDPNNADLLENLAGATRKAAMYSLIGIRDDTNELVQIFRKAGSKCGNR